MSSVIAIIFIVFAVGALVVTVAAGLATFSPERAKALRVAEEDIQIAVASAFVDLAADERQRIRTPAPVSNYRWPSPLTNRLDRHDTYVWLHLGLWLVSWNLVLSTIPNTNLSSLSPGTQLALGGCLLVGTTMILVGTCLGLKVGSHFVIARRVKDNIVSPILGDDIRVPYVLAFFGLLSISVSMSFYTWTIISASYSRLLGTLGGGLALAITLMSFTLSIRLLVQLRGYVRARDALLAEAAARVLQRRGEL